MKKSLVLHDNKIEYEDSHMIHDSLSIHLGTYDELDDEMRPPYGSIRYSVKK